MGKDEYKKFPWELILPMGTNFLPMGTIFLPMGTIFLPMGTNLLPMGTIFFHIGTIFLPMGTYYITIQTLFSIWIFFFRKITICCKYWIYENKREYTSALAGWKAVGDNTFLEPCKTSQKSRFVSGTSLQFRWVQKLFTLIFGVKSKWSW